MMDTIFAMASGQGKAGVAVIRLSGPRAFDAARAVCGALPPLRSAGLRTLCSRDGDPIDKALVLCFADKASFTGEPVVEFHTHGSPAVQSAVLARLAIESGCRLAEPGEFTRRALENGRLDLTEVEGLADLIAAETEAQRRQALRVFSGELGQAVAGWRADLTRAGALIAVTVDFADEDVPTDTRFEVLALLDRVLADIETHLTGYAAAERVREGFEVALIGPPNIGKSTLLNTLAGRDAALTSEIAGTTRDVIEVRMNLDGLPVTILDTAGLRETSDKVESLGIARARERAEQADLRVILTPEDGSLPPGIILGPTDIVRRGQADRTTGVAPGVSGLTGEGVQALVEDISERVAQQVACAGLAVHQRHFESLTAARAELTETRSLVANMTEYPELVAESLRRATRTLDALVGRVDVEDILGEIFSSFCLGK